ncbi:MAG: DUF935 family protein [Candidatus Kapabacteria bacterium]|nr:DUF935 family protein [Candidatus Kapabacteria bacterium]
MNNNLDEQLKTVKKQKGLMGVAIRNTSNARQAMRYIINNALPNPDLVLKKIGKDIDEYDRIKSDPHLASCIQSRKSGTLSLKWELQSNNAPAYIFSFIKDIIEKLDIQRIMTEMLEAPLYGFVVMEVYWTRQHTLAGEPRLVVSDLVAKSQTKFAFDENCRLRIKTSTGQLGELAKNNKFILLRHGSNFFTNPYGDPVLSKCYWEVHWKRNIMDMKFNYLDRFGIPNYIIKKDSSSLINEDVDTNEMRDILDNLVQGGSVVMPDGFLLERLESTSSLSVDMFQNMILMCNSEISKAVLSQTLTTEQGATGSYAMSQTHLQVRKDVIDSDKLIIESAFKKVIDFLVEYNFGNEFASPKFVLYSEQEVDKELATVVQNFLHTNKIKFEKSFFQKNFGWEENEFELVEPQTKFNDTPQIDTTTNPTTNKVVNNKTIQERLDEAISNALKDSGKNINSAVAPVKSFLENKGSYENAISSIMDLYDSIDYEEARKKLEQILFVSDIIGRLSVNQLIG